MGKLLSLWKSNIQIRERDSLEINNVFTDYWLIETWSISQWVDFIIYSKLHYHSF